MSSKAISSCWGFPLLVVLILALNTEHTQAAESASCGQRLLTFKVYITQGTDALEGDWPWHAAIFRAERKKETYICGGTVISENFVVTDSFTAKLGLHIKSSPSEHSKSYDIVEVIRHESYNVGNLENDIALLRTGEDITYTDYVQPICLWPVEQAELSSVLSSSGTVVGWGVGDDDIAEDILQKATLSVVDYATCVKSKPAHFQRILSNDKSNYCAGNKNMMNVCYGDAGGGMYFKLDGAWYIRGIVSAGVRGINGHCDPQQYVTFSDIPFYLGWIVKHQEVVKKRNLLNLGNCGLDSHNAEVLEKDKPLFLQYPWTAMLEFKHEGSSTITAHCNGALIHPRFVITAGHCVENYFKKIKLKAVRLGEYDLKTNPDKAKPTNDKEISTTIQSIDIEKVFIHPDFNKPRYDSSLALLKLKHPADIDRPNVKPICIPTLEDFNQNYIITGWKRSNSQAHLLTRDTVVLESSDVCRNIIQKINVNGTKNILCGTYLNEVILAGLHYQSGALLQYVQSAYRKNHYFLKGLLSFGFTNYYENYTNMFTSIHGYTDWIAEIVKKE